MVRRISAMILLSLFTVGLLSCSKQIVEPVRTDTVDGAPEVPHDLQTLIADEQVVLSWSVNDASQITQFMIYRGDTTVAGPVLIDSTTAQTYTNTGLRNGLRYIYQVTSIGSSGLESKRSLGASATPNTYSIQLENGATYTRDRNVTVNLTAPSGTRFVLLGTDANFTGSQWSLYQSAKSVEIPSGDGVKTVYARFRDFENNETAGEFTDEIILDTRASILSVTENSNGAVLTAGSTVLFTVDAGETGGKASVDVGNLGTIDLLDVDPNVSGSVEDGVYQTLYTVPGAVDVVDAIVKANFTDEAGNVAPSRNATTFINVANPPIASTLTAFVKSEKDIELSWTRSQATDFARYLVFRSDKSNVSTDDELLQTVTSASTTTYSDSDLDPSTTYHYAVFTVDASGLMSKSNEISSTTFENKAPKAVTLFISNEDSTSVSLGWTTNNDTDFESYRIYRSTSATVDINNDDNLIGVVTNKNTISYTDNNVTKGTVYNYVVVVYDQFGAKSPASNQVSGPNP